MANKIYPMHRNIGTQEQPVWEKYFPLVLAEAVQMGLDDPTNIQQYIEKRFEDLIGGAPESLDTLKEIADYLAEHEEMAEALNAAIGNKVDKVAGKGLSENDYTTAEKNKLAGIAEGANKYTHPENHPADMITESEEKQFVTADEKEQWNSNTRYVNETPLVDDFRGFKAGQSVNMSLSEIVDTLLYPYVAPAVSASITAPGNGGVVEKGSTQNVTKIRVSVTKKSAAITKVEIFDGITSLGVKTEDVANGGTFDFDVSVAVTTNKGFNAKVTDSTNKITTANTGSFNFVYPYYMGVCAADASVDEALVKGLQKKVEAKGNKSNAYTCVNQRMVYAYPASYGGPSKILDPNNFDVTGTFTKQTINITGLDGQAVSYIVLYNEPSTVTNFKMTFNH